MIEFLLGIAVGFLAFAAVCRFIDWLYAEELDSLDLMVSSLVEVLAKKGILTEDEWEKQIKVNMEKNAGKTRYRDIQFAKEP